jgi:hypothetical protein
MLLIKPQKIIILFIISLLISGLQAQRPEKGYVSFIVTPDSNALNSFTYNFTDQSVTTGLITNWQWDFGDGTSGTGQTITHIYDHPGIYQVCLTISINYEDKFKDEELCKRIRVAEKGYFNLGGHVFAEQFPIDRGIAYLYKLDTLDKYHLTDTSHFDTLGFYYFYQKKNGRYIVKAEADHESGHASTHLPTYYGNQTSWELAHLIQFDSTVWEYDINLSYAAFSEFGQGCVSGRIVKDTTSNRFQNAINIPVYLTHASKSEQIFCFYSDEQGIFRFDDIPNGTYHIRAEVTGMTANIAVASITDQNPENNNILMVIKDGQIALGQMPMQEEPHEPTPLYPNPVSQTLNIKLQDKPDNPVTLEIYQMNGNLVFDQTCYPQNQLLELNIHQLPNGIYVLKIISANKLTTNSFIKK